MRVQVPFTAIPNHTRDKGGGSEMAEDGTVPEPDLKWPSNFPSACPPADAVPAVGEVYRVVASDPPTADDFRHWVDEFPDRPIRGDVNDAHAMSVYRDRDEGFNQAEYLVSVSPRLRGGGLAVGKLSHELGKTKLTPSLKGRNKKYTHTSWWAPLGAVCHPRFKVIKRDG